MKLSKMRWVGGIDNFILTCFYYYLVGAVARIPHCGMLSLASTNYLPILIIKSFI